MIQRVRLKNLNEFLKRFYLFPNLKDLNNAPFKDFTLFFNFIKKTFKKDCHIRVLSFHKTMHY